MVLAGALLAGTSLGASVVVGTGTAAAATTTVNCATTNLQTVINNAASGDTLVVTGTCKGNFTIADKALTLLGSGHAVLAGQNYGPVLAMFTSFPPIPPTDVTVANFSIINGTRGGTFNGQLTGLTLRDDVITGNSNAVINGSAGDGGGVDTEGFLTVDHSVITGNSAGNMGGGIGNTDVVRGFVASVTVNDSTITGNSAPVGGGIGEEAAFLTVSNTTVNGNSGGGISDPNGTGNPATINDSSINGNTGGGLTIGPFTTLQNSRVIGNTSSGDGGGITGLGPVELDNSTVIGNTAAGNGGGLFLRPTFSDTNTATLTNSEVRGNTAGANGGGIFVSPQTNAGEPSESVTLNSTSVSGNTPNNCYPLASVGGCTG